MQVRLIRSLDALRRLALDVAAGKFGAQNPIRTGDEFGELGSVMAQMAREIEEQHGKVSRARDYIKSILENIHTYIVLLDGRQKVVYSNKFYSQMASEQGFNVESFTDEISSDLQEVLESGQGKDLEISIDNEAGTKVHFQLVLSPFGDPTEPSERRVLLTITNITESKFLRLELERHAQSLEEKIRDRTKDLVSALEGMEEKNIELQEAKERALESELFKGEFIARVSHEIRTPINGILGMTELLLGMNVSEELRENLSVIRSSALHLLAVLNDVLDLSKIEAGKLNLENTSFDPITTIKSLTFPLCTRAHQKGLEFLVDLPWELPIQIIGDPHRFSQILLNMVSNAIKFTHQGHVLIKVKILEQNEGKILLGFTVSDTGIGIPQEKIGTIFESFSQVQVETSRMYGGTGLGTNICMQLVQLMGGNISVESEVGKGSEFHFQLPFDLPDSTDSLDVEEHLSDLKGKSVLLLEPYKPSQRIIGQYLNGLGLRCLSVDRVRTAEEFLSSSKDGEAFDYVMVGLPVEHFDEEVLEAWLQDYFIDQKSKILIMIPEAFQGIRFYGFHALIHILKEPIYPKDLLHALVDTSPAGKIQEKEEEVFSESADTVAMPTGIRVLVVDDHEINRIVIQEMLQKNGYEVIVAEDGDIALEKLSQSKFDVVFMDVQMPVRDGLSTCKAIRESEKSTSEHLPVAGMTAGVTENDRKNCLEAGMDAYLGKPITEKALLDILSGLVEHPCQEPASTDEGPTKILVVEDNLLNQRLISRILANYGYSVTVEENGALGLERFQKESYDLILMDLMMPVMSGFEAAKEIRKLESHDSHIPIIAVSADRSEGVELRCQEAGMDDYMPKPIHPRGLLKILSQYLDVEESKSETKPLSTEDESLEEETPGVDLEFLHTHYGGDPSLVSFVIKRTCQETGEKIEGMEKALEEKDGTSLSGRAHALKGVFAYLNAHDMIDCATRLEKLGKEDQFQRADEELDHFKSLWVDARKSLESELKRLALSDY
jgi:CheY-like chemotaxis protein/signal transduction histidine kinase/HPt (histidine-containing phosphotransfer) domain-containing protein